MKRLLGALIVIAVLIVSAVGCGGKQSSTQTTPQQAQATTPTAKATSNELYIEVSALGNLPYFYDHKLGMKKVGEDLGVQTEYVGPPDYNMAEMINAMEQAIAKKPAGLVVVGFEDSLVPIVNKAVDSGIPVVTVDADLPTSKRIAFVGTGNIIMPVFRGV